MQAEFSERYDCIMVYQDLSRAKLIELQKQLSAEYDEYKKAGLKLDMSRGRPGKEQLDIALDMLTDTSYLAESGMTAATTETSRGFPNCARSSPGYSTSRPPTYLSEKTPAFR